MKDSPNIGRRAFIGAMMLTAISPRARAQGFAGLAEESQGFAQVIPDAHFEFPRAHGPHPDFHIEWWYLTANLEDASGVRYGAQWTLFRQATIPSDGNEGWDSRQLWMGHAAVTSADSHSFAERLARGGVGQAGIDITPFRAWIDSWEMRGGDGFSPNAISPLEVSAIGPEFGFSLQLASSKPLVLQGEGGYSKKSERGQASYYYSQPFFSAAGALTLKDKQVAVTGHAWMDREWSSQPLASDQTGWDWFSLHLESGEKIMLFRLRQNDGQNYFAANWITQDSKSTTIARETIAITPMTFTDIAGRRQPTSWSIVIGDRGVKIESVPLNPKSWMGTRFAYWEGPISFSGSHNGIGYLEMTGY